MKKVISFLCSILLVSAFCFGLVSCTKTTPVSSEKEDPRTFSFELVEDENGKETYTFTGFSLSEEAQALADAGNYAELAKLFNTDLKAGETTFNAETVRKFAVPQVFEGIKVTKVAMNAVSYQNFITELVIPKTIEEIELGSFVGLSSLEKITIPFAGAKLGGLSEKRLFGYIFGEAEYTGSTAITQTFNNGSSENTKTYHIPASLKTVVITGDIKVANKEIGYYINAEDKMVVLKDGETAPEGFEMLTLNSQSYAESAVQPYAFYGVSMIENVEFKGTATIIPDYAFYGCGIKNLTIPTTVKTISKFAFANCASIKTIDLANVTEIREGGFNGCSSIGKNTETTVGSLNLSKVTTLGKDAFVGCSSLDAEKVTFNSSLTEEVKKDAFGEDFFEEE